MEPIGRARAPPLDRIVDDISCLTGSPDTGG